MGLGGDLVPILGGAIDIFIYSVKYGILRFFVLVIACFYVPGIIIVLIAIIALASASNDYNDQLSRVSYN